MKFCGRWGKTLTTEIAIEMYKKKGQIDEVMNELFQDKDKSRILKEWISGIVSQQTLY